MIRNLLVFACVAAIIGTFVYIARPEWFDGLIASGKKMPEEFVTIKTTLLLPIGGKGPPACSDGTDVRRIVDLEEEGLPIRTAPYIMVVNTSDKTIRYYRLTPAVKSAALRYTLPGVNVKLSRTLDSNGPLQLEIWIPNERELALDVEFLLPKR